MAAPALLHARAQRDEILVAVDDAAFNGLRCFRVVPAMIEGHPPALVLLASTDFWPRLTTAHPARNLYPVRHVGPTSPRLFECSSRRDSGTSACS